MISDSLTPFEWFIMFLYLHFAMLRSWKTWVSIVIAAANWIYIDFVQEKNSRTQWQRFFVIESVLFIFSILCAVCTHNLINHTWAYGWVEMFLSGWSIVYYPIFLLSA
jgi:hypothetical protein